MIEPEENLLPWPPYGIPNQVAHSLQGLVDGGLKPLRINTFIPPQLFSQFLLCHNYCIE